MRLRTTPSGWPLRAWLVALVTAGLLAGPARAFELPDFEVPRSVAIGIDLAVVRPLGLFETAIGMVLFVPMGVLALPGGRDGLQEVWETHCAVPAEDVFLRPLGEF